jgi:CBS domain-containing protein
VKPQLEFRTNHDADADAPAAGDREKIGVAMFLDEKSGKKKIAELAANLQGRALPVTSENAVMTEIVEEMIRFGHSRILYAMDEERRLLGTISLGDLVRDIFSRSYEPLIHPRRLMTSITMEKAGHMMQKHPVFARMAEELRVVLAKMIQAKVKEIAIIDDENRIVGDINMLYMLKFPLEQKDS